MGKTDRPPTLADVAAIAGVHLSTVSRTISHPELVAPATRQRVESAIAELDFAPNPRAQSLHQGRTGAIGLLVPDITNPYFAEIVRAAQDEVQLEGLVLLIADTQHEEAGEARAFRALQPHVDGMVVCTPVGTDHDVGRTPVVYVNRRAVGVCSVTVDQEQVVQLAAEHLTAMGHRRIAWLNGPSNYWSVEQRRLAISRLEGRSVRHDVIADLEPTFDGGWKGTHAALASDVSAVVAFNDLMALGVLAAAAANGVAVPDELSVVGSDDVQAASTCWPALTTIASPFGQIGQVAVQSLLRARDGRRPRSTVLAPALRVRQSTAGPR